MTGMILGVLKGDHIIMQQYKYLVHIFISFFSIFGLLWMISLSWSSNYHLSYATVGNLSNIRKKVLFENEALFYHLKYIYVL